MSVLLCVCMQTHPCAGLIHCKEYAIPQPLPKDDTVLGLKRHFGLSQDSQVHHTAAHCKTQRS